MHMLRVIDVENYHVNAKNNNNIVKIVNGECQRIKYAIDVPLYPKCTNKTKQNLWKCSKHRFIGFGVGAVSYEIQREMNSTIPLSLALK